MGYIDVDTPPVVSAGHNTAATSGTWQSWAGQSDTAFRTAASDVRDSTVSGAIESYASNWNPKLHSVGQQVDALGTNTSSAANVVTNGDSSANGQVRTAGSSFAGHQSSLNRPIQA